MDEGQEFEWDPEKDRANQAKHRLRLSDGMLIWADTKRVDIADPAHSSEEARRKAIGRVDEGLVLIAVYTMRGRAIRLISVRRTSPKEREAYERGTSE